MKSKLVIVVFAIVACVMVLHRGVHTVQVFSWDKAGYYLYLPATIIYRDLEEYEFYRDKSREYHLTGGIENYGLTDLPNGKKLNKYAIGVAVMQLPFFLVAHAYASGSPKYLADGYNYPYTLAVILSCIFWVSAGLWLLRNFLLKYFPENAVFLTLLAIGFGTNLYYYTIYDQGMSHPYSFFLFAAVLWLTEKWYADFRLKHVLLLGLVLGLIFITRPVNIVLILVPLLWKVHDIESLRRRISEIRIFFPSFLLAAVCFFLILMIQFSYWKFVTGHWIFYSYGEEGFNFRNPEIINGLFSYRKGWFVYTPIAFISFIGFIFLWKQYRPLVPALIIFFSFMIYVVFSWYMWFYGGSFGCRPLIETLPIAAIPLASVFCYGFWVRSNFIKIPIITLTLFLIGLNLFQSVQYKKSIIHWDSMSKEYYWKVFGKLKVNHDVVDRYLKN